MDDAAGDKSAGYERLNGGTFEIKALVKFMGPKFFKDSAQPDEIRIARVVYVPVD